MVNNKIGYACINMALSYPTKYGNKPRGTQPITTNRSMIKRTFEDKGVDYASELILQNVKDLNQIISWNVINGYDFYRMSSDITPWKTEYDWDDLKDIEQISRALTSLIVKEYRVGNLKQSENYLNQLNNINPKFSLSSVKSYSGLHKNKIYLDSYLKPLKALGLQDKY